MFDPKYATHEREPFFEIARGYISGKDKILDIGPGDGSFAKFCKRNDIYMFEGNPESAFLLSKTFPNVIQGSLPNLPYEDQRFNLIHMSHVIEHLNPQEVYDTLIEINRCCKPGGRIIISAPLLWTGFYDDLSHIKPYPPESFIKYLSNLGTNATRPIITDTFKLEKIQYRYLAKQAEIRTRNRTNLIDKVLYKASTILRNTETYYEKTGYTVVLRKFLDTV
jgi:ubiquinone/menaquinone biosynthesis C-methylase UbiE